MDGGRVAAVVLAAGGATRMGSPKGVLRYRGRALVRIAAEAALDAGCRPIAVVLGAQAERIGAELGGLPLTLVTNQDWADGPGGSIRLGVRSIVGDEAVEAVCLLLADQPLVGPEAVTAVVNRFRRDRPPVVASEYGGTLGVPALFARSIFPDLLALPDARGAQPLILAAGDRVGRVPFPDGVVDVDTPADYDRLLARPYTSPARGDRSPTPDPRPDR